MTISLLLITTTVFTVVQYFQHPEKDQLNNHGNITIMNHSLQDSNIDHSDKTILARGCDPELSAQASQFIPPLIGNPAYIPTTTDIDFIHKLKSQKWSIIYFAPGACRYSNAKQQIPGGNNETQNWTLDDYKRLVFELQGDDVLIVETPQEDEALALLRHALEKARSTK